MQSRPFWQNHKRRDVARTPKSDIFLTGFQSKKMKKIHPKVKPLAIRPKGRSLPLSLSSGRRVGGQHIKISLREATESDIPRLGVHHRKMFEEILKKKGESLNPSVGKKMERTYVKKLKQELTNGSCKAWVIEHKDRTVASGAITIANLVPTPKDLSSSVAYLHSMYTEKEYRNKGFANLIVERAIRFCRGNGIKRVFLNASEAGRSIYEKAGFRAAPEMMRLAIE
jgi:GNAT superfamily N-acetyltransferase